MRIIQSANPASLMNRVIYGSDPDPYQYDRTREALERLESSLGSDLFSMVDHVYGQYVNEDIFSEASDLIEDVQETQEENVTLLFGGSSNSATRPNDKTRRVAMMHPVIYKMYKEKRLNGFGEEYDYDHDTYEDIINGYCDENIDCREYGGLEPTVKLTKKDKYNAIENFYDILESQKKKIDLTDL